MAQLRRRRRRRDGGRREGGRQALGTAILLVMASLTHMCIREVSRLREGRIEWDTLHARSGGWLGM